MIIKIDTREKSLIETFKEYYPTIPISVEQLDIGDVNLSILNDEEKGYKEIVVAYKTMYTNLFNILIMDLNHASD